MYLEEVTADAPARVVAEDVLTAVDHVPGRDAPLRFALVGGGPVDPRHSYAVRAHVDVDGDGSISLGDYISMESYPVLTFGYPRTVSIEVRRIG